LHAPKRQHQETIVSIRISINPNSWALDDIPELRNFSTLEQCLSEVRACGYAGIEMGVLFPRTSAALRQILGAHALALISGWYDGHLHEREVAKEFDAAVGHLRLLKDIVHFHGKGARGKVLEASLKHDWSFLTAVMKGVYTVPPDGMIDYATILRTLREAGYKGWLVVEAEQEPRNAPPLIYARHAFDNLSTLARTASFEVKEPVTPGIIR
jgi:sugar phosphate isomerase/epimerase